MLAPGNYRGRPVRAALGITSKGNEQIAVEFELVEPAGERMSWYGFFTEATTDRTVESLRHCGWKGDDLSVFTEGEPLPEGFDQEVDLVVKHEEYEGKTRARIAWVNSGGGLALKNALTKDQAQAFAARMKRQVVALDKAAGRAQATPGQARPAAVKARAAAAPPSDLEEVPQEHLDARAAEELGGRVGDVPF